MENKTDTLFNKDLQNVTVKLWELIKNSSDVIKNIKNENKAILEQNQLLHNMLDKKDDSSIDMAKNNSLLLNKNKQLTYEVDEKNRMISILKEDNSFLKTRLESFNDIDSQLDEKDRHIDELVLENQSLMNECYYLKGEKNKVIILEEQFENQSKNLSDEYFRIKEENNALYKKIESYNQVIARKDADIFEYQALKTEHKRLQNMHSELKSKIEELSALTKDHTQLKHKLDSLERDNKILNIKLRKFNEINNILRYVRQDNIDKNILLFEKSKYVDSLREKNAILDNQNYKLRKQVENFALLNDRLSENDSVINELKAKLYKTETEVNVYNAKNDNLQDRLAELQSKINEYEPLLQKNTNLRDKLSNAFSELEKFKDSYNYKEKMIEEKNIEITKLHATISNMKSESEIYNKNLASMRLLITENDTERKSTQEVYDKALARVEELEQTIADIKNSKNILKADYISKKEEIKQLESRLDELVILQDKLIKADNIIQSQDKALENLNSEISDIRNDIADKEIIINELNNKCTHSNEKIKRLQHELTGTTSKDSIINDMVSNARDKIYKHNKMKSQLTDLETTIKELNNINTIKDIELNKFKTKTLELENLLKRRYEQIQLLEEQMNQDIRNKAKDDEKKLELATEIDDYIKKIDSML